MTDVCYQLQTAPVGGYVVDNDANAEQKKRGGSENLGRCAE